MYRRSLFRSVWIGNSVISICFSQWLINALVLRIIGGSVLAKTLSHSTGVEATEPVMTRRASFTASTGCVCALAIQNGAPYSAAGYTRTRAEVRRTDVLAPHVDPANFRKRLI